MKNFIIVAGILAWVFGCAPLDNWTTDNQGTVDAALNTTSVVAAAAAPFTMGWSEIIAWAITSLVPIGIAINRTIVAKQRATVILEADASPKSPKMKTQVSSTTAKATIKKLTG